MINSRRYDLDWLRVIAFLVLIYFHAAVFFVPGGIPMIQNSETSPGLDIFIDISSQFRLALLFFISGVGVYFAQRRLSKKAFLLERSKRLLIPLLMGLVFIVPPMVFIEKRFLGLFDGDLLGFYTRLVTDGVYPAGNLSWHHLWFLVYLFLYCLLGIACFDRIGLLIKTWLNGLSGLGIYSFILPLLVVEIVLRALFPGFRDLIHDWASFSQWFLFFTAGYFIAQCESILSIAQRYRWLSFSGFVVAASLAYLFFGGINVMLDLESPYLVISYLTYCLLRVSVAWFAVLTCVGFAAQHLRFDHPVLSFLNQAVYPLFLTHLTVLTGLAYWIVDWQLALWIKYLVLTSVTMFIILLIYRFAIAPFGPMRFLFGLKPQTSATQSIDLTSVRTSGLDDQAVTK